MKKYMPVLVFLCVIVATRFLYTEFFLPKNYPAAEITVLDATGIVMRDANSQARNEISYTQTEEQKLD
jgi:hypothetical protein